MHDLQTTLRIGDVLRGHYRIIEVLGQGTLGAVYLIKDERNSQKQFTLKEVMHTVREERSYFPFDASALKRLNHPALPEIHRVFSSENNDRFYILMDYVEGSNLEKVRQLMPGKRFSLHTALTLMSPIMEAISYLHRQHPHLVHGDIKPSNIIAPLAGTVSPTKLVDFGGVHNLFKEDSAQLSVLNYRAPEQYNKKASRRTDVYSLGATFYTLLTGKVPVSATERLALISEGESDPLVPINHINPFVQTVVVDAINCAMSLSRNDRFVSVENFREALWQVMHTTEMEPQVLGLSIVVPDEEQMQSHSGPDSSMLEAEFPALLANTLMQAEVESAEVFSGPLLSPAIAGVRTPPTAIHSRKRHHTSSHQSTTSRVHSSKRRRKHRVGRFTRLGLIFLVVCLIGSGVVVSGYQVVNAKYVSEVALAQVGTKHLQSALHYIQTWTKNPLDAYPVTQAQEEFTAATKVFAQLDSDVQSFSGVATIIPGYGSGLRAASHVVPIALKISQAGITGCEALNLLISKVRSPFGVGISADNLNEISRDFLQVEDAINLAIRQVSSLQAGDLQFDARIGKAVVEFRQYLPSVQALLKETGPLLSALPGLLGIKAPAFYLVEILDSTQLRPGGGFIKDYGFATLIRGQLNAVSISDTNLLDTDFAKAGHAIAYPPQYKWFDPVTPISNSWNLHNSNLDADFPTAAGYAEDTYNFEGGAARLEGVFAITTGLMENALQITGPISISAPGLQETVTSKNLVHLIHYYQLHPVNVGGIVRPGSNASGSRYFTQLLAQNFLSHLRATRSTTVPKLLQMLVNSLRTKDMQIFFNNTSAESLLQLAHIDAAIHPSQSDSFFVVDTNVSTNDANQFITNTIDDQVTIDDNGNAIHHTTLHYAWLQGNVFGSPVYGDYARIYVPPGSVLQTQQGWQQQGYKNKPFGHTVWAGLFSLSQGQTKIITLIWVAKGASKKDAAGWHYHYLLQRQAGVNWTLNVHVSLPACVVKTPHTSGGLGPVSRTGQTTLLNHSLMTDMVLGIDYSC